MHECLCKESGCNNNFENAGDQGGGDETTSEHPATRLKVGCIPVVPSYLFLYTVQCYVCDSEHGLCSDTEHGVESVCEEELLGDRTEQTGCIITKGW